jgi:hypothetical protein
MKMLLNIRIPNESFNEHVRQGNIGETVRSILDDLQPEFVYFTEQDGQRGLIMIIEVSAPEQIPFFAEPWFLKFNAECEFRVAMSPEELGKAELEALGEKWA